MTVTLTSRAAGSVFECPPWCQMRKSDPGHAPERPHIALVGTFYGEREGEVCVGIRQAVLPFRDGSCAFYPPRRLPPVVVLCVGDVGDVDGPYTQLTPAAALIAGRAALILDPDSSLGAALVEAAEMLAGGRT